MFIFSTCQAGAEATFKREISRIFPDMRPAFARPGFVSFRSETPMPENIVTRSVFARTAAVSLGTLTLENAATGSLAAKVWNTVAENHLFINRVHIFVRDPLPVGEQNFEPHLPEELVELHQCVVEQSPNKKLLGKGADDVFHPAQSGETVLDVLKVDPDCYLVGTHSLAPSPPIHVCYPGGILPLTLPADAVSRAYLKFQEGFLWSGISLRSGDRCLDIGASPGGCSQFLLEQGVTVFGVDPGEIHPAVLTHPQFTHIRCRIKDMKRSFLRDFQWITADMNVAPNYTLDVLEDIIAQTSIQGILFTLKLIRWELAEKLPMLLDRIHTWGFSDVRMKQLAFNRQEVMVVAKQRYSSA